MSKRQVRRCQWVANKPDFYLHYHDCFWCQPEHDDRQLFRWLLLETFHTGLSWQLVLSKESAFAEAFDDYDYQLIAHYTEDKVQKLLNNADIIRHEGKIRATLTNAQAFMKVQEDYGSFDRFIWQFTAGMPVIRTDGSMPTRTELSDKVTHQLKQYGFKYIGSVTIYSYLQAIGVVNDHDPWCDFK